MFWRMTGLSANSPVDNILDKENYTLEELLDEDEIIQECKALNSRLINFLRERAQVEQLLRYIVEEAPEDAEKRRTFKFPFIACEIFTCEVDIILRTLVEDEELMNLLFSFLKPDHPHSTLLAGYFSKVVVCLMLRKTASLVNYVKGHQAIFCRLVDLIGTTSIMEVLIRLMGADENMCSNDSDGLQWLEDTNVLDMIVDKFSSSDSPEVHANAAEVLCAITRYAPPGLAAKICSPSFVRRLFCHALEESRPKSVLIHSLSVCISLLDPRRLVTSGYQSFRSQLNHGSLVTANPETADGMLESLGDLLKLLDISSHVTILPTTYGSLHPPLGKHRLKIVEFISVLLTTGSEAAEKELIGLGVIKRIFDMFFEFPFNNFLHHHVENILGSCLETNRIVLVEHLLHECDIVGKILAAEKHSMLSTDHSKPTVSAEGRPSPRVGNVGHMTRIANKLSQLGNSNNIILTHLQGNSEWVDWHTNALLKRNALENVYQWACGRPTSLQDRTRDSDDEDFRDRDYDVATLSSNLSQAFRYGIYNDDVEEAHGSLERDAEDVYFDDESAEVVISSLRLGDGHDGSSLFTNSNWFAFEDDRAANDRSAGSIASPSPNSDETDEVVGGENKDLADTATSLKLPRSSGLVSTLEESTSSVLENGPLPEFIKEAGPSGSAEETGKAPEWVEWRETSDSGDLPSEEPTSDVPTGRVEAEKEGDMVVADACKSEAPVPTAMTAEALLPGSGEGIQFANPTESVDPVSSSLDSQPQTSAALAGNEEHDEKLVENDSK